MGQTISFKRPDGQSVQGYLAERQLRPRHLSRKAPVALPQPKTILPNDVVGVSVGVSDVRVKRITKDLRELR